jgi:hypothetical protein
MRFSLAVVLLSSSGAFAIEVKTGSDDFKLNVNVLLQARAVGSWDGDKPTTAGGASPNGTFDTDFYIRRARLITSGTAYKKFTFYIMLDTPNFGIRGNYTGSTFLQDLHIGYVPAKDVDIEVGFLYMPLSHLSMNSSSSTSAIEKSTAILFYNNNRGLRETGAQIRALLFDRRILVRGGIYEGLHGDPQAANATTARVNPNGRPLAAGMLRLNLVGYEAGYAYPSIYLDGKTRVSIGVGGQFQTKGSNTPVTSGTVLPSGFRGAPVLTAVNDYVALAADAFADIALPGDTEFAIQADIYRFDWGAGSDKTGFGTTLEIGYRWGQIEPEVNGYWFNSDSRQNNFLKVAAGVNYFLKGHQAKLSAEFWTIKSGVNLDSSRALHQIVLQAQANF